MRGHREENDKKLLSWMTDENVEKGSRGGWGIECGKKNCKKRKHEFKGEE